MSNQKVVCEENRLHSQGSLQVGEMAPRGQMDAGFQPSQSFSCVQVAVQLSPGLGRSVRSVAGFPAGASTHRVISLY